MILLDVKMGYTKSKLYKLILNNFIDCITLNLNKYKLNSHKMNES